VAASSDRPDLSPWPPGLSSVFDGVPVRVATDGWCVYEVCGALLCGGPPARGRSLEEAWVGGDACPPPLGAVLAVHDGMGPLGVPRAPFGTPRLLPLAGLAPLTRWMRFGEENILYRPADWLRFTVDLEGGWCVSPTGEVRHWRAGDHGLGPAAAWEEVWDQVAAGWQAG
jgi:hypothetical protein